MPFEMVNSEIAALSAKLLLWQATPPLKPTRSPDKIADPCVFLASEMGRYITGATLAIDGGTEASSGWVRDTQNRWAFPIVIELAI